MNFTVFKFILIYKKGLMYFFLLSVDYWHKTCLQNNIQ